VDAGATVRLKIPLTLAIIPGLIVETGGAAGGEGAGESRGHRFVIPQVSLVELIRLDGDNPERKIEWLHNAPVFRRRGELLPVAFLNGVLGLEKSPPCGAVNIVVVQAEQRLFGLIVDHILDTQEIVVKPLAKQLKSLPAFAGATIMGDGRVALILDVMGIGKISGVFSGRAVESQAVAVAVSQQHGLERILLFRSKGYSRIALPLSVVARLEEFPQSSIERAAGRAVVQYRDHILPLVPLEAVLSGGNEGDSMTADPVQVVVIKEDDRMLGMVVEEILDIIEDRLEARQESSHRGLLGAAVMQKKITDVLDLQPVIDWVGDAWKSPLSNQAGATSVLLAEGSRFRRGLLRNVLEMAGMKVLEAENEAAAVRCLEAGRIDVVVAATDLPPEGCAALLRRLKEDPKLKRIPVLGALAGTNRKFVEGFDDCQVKEDPGSILASVRRMAEALERTSGNVVLEASSVG
jgi:two-component system chemotaxis sensor kinase CheA